jgi:hypothetical protein
VSIRRLPLDPPWLLIPIVGGQLLAVASVWNESWSIAVTYLGMIIAISAGTFGVDRWYERNRRRRPPRERRPPATP